MILFSLALVLSMLYVAVVVLSCVGWLMGEAPGKKAGEADLTIVIPFRNEAKNLPRLLNSLLQQQTPARVILVNDHSTDESLSIIQTFTAKNKMDLLVLSGTGEGKKNASITGLNAARTPYVFFTDADCTFSPAFFTHVRDTCTRFSPGFFYAPVLYGANGKRTNAVFFLDQLALNAMALGLGKTGIHTYCSGAAMGGSVQALGHAEVALRQSRNLSGDDVTYLQLAVAQKQKVLALTDRALTVYTAPPSGLREFLAQRLRWGQKAPGYKSGPLLLLSVLVFSLCLLNCFVIIACLSDVLPAWWWAIPFIKLCIDLLFLFLVALRLRVSGYLWAFVPAWLLNLFYVPATGLLGMFINTTWKGRKVKKI